MLYSYGYEQKIIGVKNVLAEKEKKVEESTHVLIKNLNNAELKHNNYAHELEIL